jgi:hypothetical protein
MEIVFWVAATLIGITYGGIPLSPDQVSAGIGAISSMALGSLGNLIQRQNKNTKSTPMYDRKTPPPMLWIHLRKADPILVDREFYNVSNVPDEISLNMNSTESIKAARKPEIPNIQQMIPLSLIERPDMQQVGTSSFIEHTNKAVDPFMIANGLFLTMPLRQPPQETINVATVEDTKTIQAFADYMRKKHEIQRLDKAFRNLIRGMNQP